MDGCAFSIDAAYGLGNFVNLRQEERLATHH